MKIAQICFSGLGGHSGVVFPLISADLSKQHEWFIGFVGNTPILKDFYKKCDDLKNFDETITLGEYLLKNKLSKEFINYHLIPMVSAIWSMPPYEANKMPLKFFLKFFQNHGLFKLNNRPQWYTVSNRSRTYVDKSLS